MQTLKRFIMKIVELDTTLAELYTAHGVSWPLVVDLYHAYTHIDLHENFPREKVFAEDEDPAIYYNGEENLQRFQKWALCFKTIRFLPMIGPAAVILYLPDNVRANIQRALDRLPENQRPKIKYIDLDDPHMAEVRKLIMRDKGLIYWRPKSWMCKEDCLVAPDTSYTINDKRLLTHPDIPTPTIQTVRLQCEDSQASLVSHPLPFVVKFCRCSSGQGTFLVITEDARREMLDAVIRYRERGGQEVQVWEFIHSERPHYGVHLFNGGHKSPEPHFLGATELISSKDGAWVGSIIDYHAQEDLERLMRGTVLAVARILKESSYIGWVGIDVIVDQNDHPLVVDLNARMAGGMGLCLFSKHFLSLGLPLARIHTLSFCGPASTIYYLLSTKIESGQVIVTLSAEVSDSESMVSVVFGGKDREDLLVVCQWIEDRLPTCPK